MKIRDRDNGYRELMRRLTRADLKRKHVAVGVLGQEAAASRGGITNVEVATIHEFGSPDAGIPERSFIRAGVDENRITIAKTQVKVAEAYVRGKIDADQALSLIGERVRGLIQKRISSNIPPALKPATIARKGSSVALIDTGQLRQSITYEVRDGAKE